MPKRSVPASCEFPYNSQQAALLTCLCTRLAKPENHPQRTGNPSAHFVFYLYALKVEGLLTVIGLHVRDRTSFHT